MVRLYRFFGIFLGLSHDCDEPVNRKHITSQVIAARIVKYDPLFVGRSPLSHRSVQLPSAITLVAEVHYPVVL